MSRISIEQVKEELSTLYSTVEKAEERIDILKESVSTYLESKKEDEFIISPTLKLKKAESTTYEFIKENFSKHLTTDEVVELTEKLNTKGLKMLLNSKARNEVNKRKIIGEEAAELIKNLSEEYFNDMVTTNHSAYLRKTNTKK